MTRQDVIELIAKADFARTFKAHRWEELPDQQELFLGDAEAILSALEQSGVALVPVEATEEMWEAATPGLKVAPEYQKVRQSTWIAMLSASPYRSQS